MQVVSPAGALEWLAEQSASEPVRWSDLGRSGAPFLRHPLPTVELPDGTVALFAVTEPDMPVRETELAITARIPARSDLTVLTATNQWRTLAARVAWPSSTGPAPVHEAVAAACEDLGYEVRRSSGWSQSAITGAVAGWVTTTTGRIDLVVEWGAAHETHEPHGLTLARTFGDVRHATATRTVPVHYPFAGGELDAAIVDRILDGGGPAAIALSDDWLRTLRD